jgi:hypothetical protein
LLLLLELLLLPLCVGSQPTTATTATTTNHKPTINRYKQPTTNSYKQPTTTTNNNHNNNSQQLCPRTLDEWQRDPWQEGL